MFSVVYLSFDTRHLSPLAEPSLSIPQPARGVCSVGGELQQQPDPAWQRLFRHNQYSALFVNPYADEGSSTHVNLFDFKAPPKIGLSDHFIVIIGPKYRS